MYQILMDIARTELKPNEVIVQSIRLRKNPSTSAISARSGCKAISIEPAGFRRKRRRRLPVPSFLFGIRVMDEYAQIDLPRDSDQPGYDRALREMITRLAEFESRSEAAIVADLIR